MDGINIEEYDRTKDEIIKLYFGLLPEFNHKETANT